MIIKSLHYYPVKSLSGIDINQAHLVETGFQYDRKWMIVDESDVFISQRNYPIMAQIKTAIEGDELILKYNGSSISVPLDVAYYSHPKLCTVWKDATIGKTIDHDVNNWLSEILNKKVALVRQLDKSDRVNNGLKVSFTDSSQILFIGTASLDYLNSLMEDDLPMNRFRPNVVVKTEKPHIEDSWQTIHINNTILHQTKLCSRCRIITIDQETSERDPLPLNVLADYRRIDKKIMFGTFFHLDPGNLQSISIGDNINVDTIC